MVIATSQTLLNLLALNADTLSQDDHGVIRRLAERSDKARQDAWPDNIDAKDEQNGFIRIERVYEGKPVAMFGQDVPSLAYNRIRIYRGIAQGKGHYEEGEEIACFRCSEESLTNFLLSPNMGEGKAPLTVESLMGEPAPDYIPPALLEDEISFDASMERRKAGILKAAQGVVASFEGGLAAKNRKVISQSLNAFENALDAHGELDFYQEQRVESLSKRRVSLLVEASHAALHAQRVMDAMSNVALLSDDRPKEKTMQQLREDSPAFDVFLDCLNGEEELRAVQNLVLAELDRLCAKHGASRNAFPTRERHTWPAGNSGFFLGALKDAQKEFNVVQELARTTLIDSVVEGRAKHQPNQAVMGLARISGGRDFIHSSVPSRHGDFFTIRFMPAYHEHSFGKSNIRSAHMPFIELAMTPDDLMMAIRGHPSGKSTPCTLSCIMNLSKNRIVQEKNNEIDKKRIKADMNASPQTVQARAVIAEISKALNDGATTKAHKDHIANLGEKLIEATQNYLDKTFDESVRTVKEDTLTEMRALVQSDLDDIGQALPAPVITALIGKS